MKKSTVAIGVIVALGAIWTGGAWYTGQKAQAEYTRQINYFNEKTVQGLEFYGIKVKIEPIKFERGLFTSDYVYNTKITMENNEYNFPFSGKLYHGPIPLNTFSPAMFSADYELVNNEQTKALFDVVQGKNPIKGKFSFSYSERISGDMEAPLIVYSDAKTTSTLENLKVVHNTDKNGIGKVDMTIGSIKSTLNTGQDIDENHPTDVELTNITIKSDLTATKWEYLTTGTQEQVIENVKFIDKTDKSRRFEFKNVSVTSNASEKDNLINVGSKVKIADLQGQDQSFGGLDIDAQFNHLDADALNTLVKAVINQDESQGESAGLKLVQNQPHFMIKPELTNAAGQLKSNVNIELNQFDISNTKSILALFKQLELGVGLDKAAFTQFLVTGNQVFDGLDKAEAEKVAASQSVELLSNKDVWVDNGDNISAELKLTDGKLMLNKTQEITEEQIQMFLFMLMMGMGGSLGH